MLRRVGFLRLSFVLVLATFAPAAAQDKAPDWTEDTWPQWLGHQTAGQWRDSVGVANDQTLKLLEAELANELAATDVKPSRPTERDFLKAYASPDLKAIEDAISKFAAVSNICRDALCIKTDCRRTNDAHQKLLLLMGELSALEAWQAKAQQAINEHMSQLDSEKDRKQAVRGYIEQLRQLQVFLHEAATLVTNALDVWQGAKEGLTSPTSVAPKLQLAIDGLNQALNAITLLNQARVYAIDRGAAPPLPDWFQKGGTIYQILSDVKNLAETALYASKGVSILPEGYLSEKRQYSALQLVAKIGLVLSEGSIGRTEKLVEQYDRLMEIERQFNLTFRTEVERLTALRDATAATRGKVQAAARDFGACLKSCSAGEVLHNPNPEDDPNWKKLLSTSYSSANFSETKTHYLHYLQYYQARLKLLTRQVLTARGGVSVKSVDPQDPGAPEMCRQLASPNLEGNDDPAAGLTRPDIQFPKLTLPVRFCSDQEKLDYDKSTLTPALDEAAKVWRAAAHYDSELSIRLQKVKNSLAILQPEYEGANAEDSGSASPKVAKLKKQRDKIERLRSDFAPDLEKAGDEMTSFNNMSAAYLKLSVEDCEDITPINIMLPALPERFCSEQEKTEMVAKLEQLLEQVRKYREARRNYRQHLYERHATETNLVIKASLKKEIDDSIVIDAQGDGLVSSLTGLLEKAKTLEIGECIDPCLVGNWELRDSPFSGIRVTFKSDGTETVDYSSSEPWVLSQSPPSSWTLTGRGSAKIITPENKTAKYVASPKGDIKLYIHSKDTPPVQLNDRLIAVGLGGTTGGNAYVCTNEMLTYEGSIHRDQRPNFKVKLTRQPE